MDISSKGSYQTCSLCVSYIVIIILNRFRGRCSHSDFGGPLDNDRFTVWWLEDPWITTTCPHFRLGPARQLSYSRNKEASVTSKTRGVCMAATPDCQRSFTVFFVQDLIRNLHSSVWTILKALISGDQGGESGRGRHMCGVRVCTWFDLQYIDPCWVVLSLGGGPTLLDQFVLRKGVCWSCVGNSYLLPWSINVRPTFINLFIYTI